MRTNKKCWLKVGKVETFERCMNPREREKDIIWEREIEIILVENFKKTLKPWKENRCWLNVIWVNEREKLNILVLYFRSDLLLTNNFLLWRQTKPTKRWKRVTPEGRLSSTWRSDREVKDCVDVHKKRRTALNGWIGELCALFHKVLTSGLSLVQFVNSWKIITWYLLDNIVFIFPRMKQDLLRKWKIILVHLSKHIYAFICMMFGDRGSD